MPAKKRKVDEKPQIERFLETAREIETDNSPETFEDAFRRVVIERIDKKLNDIG